MIRITGGEFRSRKLETPDGLHTRPTSDRVRESLFNRLLPRLPGARVLDLFAGSGALSLEALSRGAEMAVLADSAPQSVAAIRANVQLCRAENRARILATDVRHAVELLSGEKLAFDLIFLDPPYAAGLYEPTLLAISRAGLLKADGIAVCEHERDAAIAPPGWRVVDQRAYGNTSVSWLSDQP